MTNTADKYCARCALPSAVPSARIDGSGMCSYCRKFTGTEKLEQKRADRRAEFERLLDTVKKNANSDYDVLIAYSGGKDSTFTVDVLRKDFNLRVLALTFDHGFISERATENIRKVVEATGVDHIRSKPNSNLINEVFRFSIQHEFHPPKALERASSICNSCMGIIKFHALRTALEKNIPMIAYGWSPGQAPMQSAILKNQPGFVQKSQQLFLEPLLRAAGSGIRAFFLNESHFRAQSLPVNVNPLAFLNYDEKEIYGRIGRLGWVAPSDTDSNSTNCLLNGFANQVHLKKHGYNPYALELSGLVREGILTRQEAIDRMVREPDPRIARQVAGKLGVNLG